MLIIALGIIALFNYYYSIARSESFRKRFTEMAVLSFSVAALSFLIGYALKDLRVSMSKKIIVMFWEKIHSYEFSKS